MCCVTLVWGMAGMPFVLWLKSLLTHYQNHVPSIMMTQLCVRCGRTVWCWCSCSSCFTPEHVLCAAAMQVIIPWRWPVCCKMDGKLSQLQHMTHFSRSARCCSCCACSSHASRVLCSNRCIHVQSRLRPHACSSKTSSRLNCAKHLSWFCVAG